MVCEHLSELDAIVARGIATTFRGRSWSRNCREWVYFDVYLDTERIRQSFRLPEFVRDHSHRDARNGQERGVICDACHDALMGLPDPAPGKPVFPD